MKKTTILSILILLLLFANLAYSFNLKNPSVFVSNELISPADRITERNIHIYSDKIIIDLPGATYARYADTNSMDPIIDKNATGIEIIPNSENEIQIGDIITYQPTWSNNLTVHRVIEIGIDEDGWYCYAKGDNTSIIDPERIRFNQVKYILVGVLY